MDEVKECGFDEVMCEVKKYVSEYIKVFGISIDFDVFDLKDVLVVGFCEKEGILMYNVVDVLKYICVDEKLVVVEIVEFNLECDVE